MPRICTRYFAMFREASGLAGEVIETEATSAAALFEDLRIRHHFQIGVDNIRVAINQEFRPMETPLADGDEVVFVPPVAGG